MRLFGGLNYMRNGLKKNFKIVIFYIKNREIMKKLFRIESVNQLDYQARYYNYVIAEEFNEAIGKREVGDNSVIKSITIVATEKPIAGSGGQLII